MLQIPTSKYTVGKNTCEFIIVHHTGGSLNFNNQVNFLASNPIPASVHYVVGQQGEVAQIGNEDMILWHCGISEWKGKTALNKYSIGIEVVGPGFTDIQRKAVSNLIVDISKRNNIPKENILRHLDVSPGRKFDIDDSFWNTNFKSWNEYINTLFLKGFYESIFERENQNGSSIFNDLDGALKRCIDENGNIVGEEFFYLTMIGLERIKNKPWT